LHVIKRLAGTDSRSSLTPLANIEQPFGGAHMKIKIILIAAVSWLLAGCATPDVPKDFSLAPDSKSGLLIGSVKFRGPVAGYRVYFKGLSNNVSGFFRAGSDDIVSALNTRYDFPDIDGKLQVTELPPGDYEINRWSAGGGMTHINQTQPFSIKFKIEAGKATYIGSFIFTVTDKTLNVPSAVEVDFVDAFDEDIGVLRQLYPNLSMADIYRGVKPGLKKEYVGGASSLYIDIEPFLLPAHMNATVHH